eukprot:TRINITY_DN10260_c0_g1_i1.p1 TRINITY_DN10260_c0_g1~~TRINITY_DN10260_c0_g1_i1.p1  ORF type:complete len:878 (+),score=76.30 TRINITY_DN10260_c0_g1_i1:70-2703(+)
MCLQLKHVLPCLLFCLAIFEKPCIGYKEVTIHSGYGDRWFEADPSSWPCLETSPEKQYIHINFLGCYHIHNLPLRHRVVWQVPEVEGPIRLASKPELCMDATRAIEHLKRSKVFSAASSLESVLQRVVTLSPCDGSVSQQFILKDGPRVSIRLASNESFMLSFDMNVVTLDNLWFHGSSAYQFTILEASDPTSGFLFGGGSGAHLLMQSLHVVQLLLLLVYVVLCCKYARGVFKKSLMFCLRRAWDSLRTRSEAKVRKMAAECRIRRANRSATLALHFCVLWMLFAGLEHPGYPHGLMPWTWTRNEESEIKAIWRLSAGELLPMVFITALCMFGRLGLIRSALTLDVLTLLASCMWAFQYYSLSQNLGGLNIERYFFQESWMMMARTLLNITIGRFAVSAPCTIVLTVVDVYALNALAASRTHQSLAIRHYHVKQIFCCFMACVAQYCVERLASIEVHSALEVQRADLHEQLATRLTVSMCDAVVHLDCDLQFSKPAPQLANILFRYRLGAFPTDFMKLIPADDHARFKSHLELAASTENMEPLMPLHVSLLDASGACCRVRVFASAYRDNEKALHYILGFDEVQDFCRASSQETHAQTKDVFDVHLQECIPEENIFKGDYAGSNASSLSDDPSQQIDVACNVNILRTCGTIVAVDAGFSSFMGADLIGHCLPAIFNDPPAVWAWIQVTADSIQANDSLSPGDASCGLYFLRQRKARFDATIIIGSISADADGKAIVGLSIRVGRRHKSSTKARSEVSSSLRSRSETVAFTCDIVLHASAAHIDVAIERLEDASAHLFMPILGRETFGDWQLWWNECFDSYADVPFQSSNGTFFFSAKKRRRKDYVASMQLRLRENSLGFNTLRTKLIENISRSIQL